MPRHEHRQLLLECDVVEMTRSTAPAEGVRKARRLFLFSDMLVCAKPTKSGKEGESASYTPKVCGCGPETRTLLHDAFAKMANTGCIRGWIETDH